jgi:radical SAM family uncharacterized protein/radical SAM-linked protein
MIAKDWDKVVGKMALCFPDTYEIGMSHLGFKILYDEVNKHENLSAERAFCPWIDMEEKMRERNLPLVTLESFTPLNKFDVVGFSLQYEMSYTNILNMLDLGGIPVKTADRTEEDPFVTCGGPCATHPEPLADFMDFVVVGDGEKLAPRLVHFIGEARANGLKRVEILEHLAQWQGIYVPQFYEEQYCDKTELGYITPKPEYLGVVPERVSRHMVDSLVDYPFPTKSPIPHMTAIFDRFSVELSRGCTEGCRFCQAGMIYRPVRERDPKAVVDMVMDGIKAGGFDEASLTCLSTADYSAVTPLVVELLDKLSKDGSTLGISSLRAYGLDKRILDKLAEVKNSSLTFAPEAGTQKMRDVINKNISEEDMLQTAKDVFSRGWKKMKLYFMIGLPTETDEDVFGIMDTAAKARKEGQKVGVRNPNVTVSVSSFVPKPHTPFQWANMISLSEIERKQGLLDNWARENKLSFRKHFSKISYLEGIVARGDRRVGNIIYDAWTKGARFDGWDDCFSFDLWLSCVELSGIDPQIYLGTIRLDGKLPWDHIDVGLKERFLEREWLKATKNRLSPPCGKIAGHIVHHSDLETLEKDFDIDKKKLVCYHCGIACDLKGMVEERRDFLNVMNANEHSEYVEPEVLKKDIAALREKRGQFIGEKYRIEFAKIGPLSFISHLDMQKVIARIFKRAEIELLHTEGYKRRPLIAFGPALTLGISSMSEFFDVRVPEVWSDHDAILSLLQKNSETGLIFKSISKVERHTPSIQVSTKEFEYFVPVKEAVNFDEIIDALNAKEKIELESYSKKRRRNVIRDVKPFIDSVDRGRIPLDSEIVQTIDEVSPCKDLDGFIFKTKVDEGVSIRPNEIIRTLEMLGIQTHRPIKVSSSVR